MLGWLRRMWFKKVPEELPTSRICHWPLTKENSQCLLLTTLDLKPIGASDGSVGLWTAIPSRSEYRPTRITEDSVGRVREVVVKGSEGREF